MIGLLPWLLAMLLLIIASAFFSASEAAVFSLRQTDRNKMAKGGSGERAAVSLLANPDVLLSAVLFWNLLVNMTYFAIAAMVGIRLESIYHPSASAAFALFALLSIIFCSEMLPKSLAVLRPRWASGWLALPLTIAVRIAQPFIPILRLAMTLSQRLIWPHFKAEVYLDVTDLERAIELSTSDETLIEQERAMLQNIVSLSSIRVEEWMRPRTQFVTFAPPVSIEDLRGEMTPSGYMLLTEPESDEVTAAINLRSATDLPATNLDQLAEEVGYTPWCASVSDALELMLTNDQQVTAVVNEFGETIGILTYDDVLDTIFTYNPSRSKRLLDRNPIHPLSTDLWLVAGVTSLRRLSRMLNIELPSSKNVTVAGVLQETLGHLLTAGDECDWGPFHFRVIEAPERGHTILEMKRIRRDRS